MILSFHNGIMIEVETQKVLSNTVVARSHHCSNYIFFQQLVNKICLILYWALKTNPYPLVLRYLTCKTYSVPITTKTQLVNGNSTATYYLSMNCGLPYCAFYWKVSKKYCHTKRSKRVLQVFCTFMIEKSVQLLFGNNHSQLVTAVNYKYDGMAFSEEEHRCYS